MKRVPTIAAAAVSAIRYHLGFGLLRLGMLVRLLMRYGGALLVAALIVLAVYALFTWDPTGLLEWVLLTAGFFVVAWVAAGLLALAGWGLIPPADRRAMQEIDEHLTNVAGEA